MSNSLTLQHYYINQILILIFHGLSCVEVIAEVDSVFLFEFVMFLENIDKIIELEPCVLFSHCVIAYN